ncbi:hypothetical protein GP486_008637, partial [Trichoglossum hirsutum]
MNLSTTTYTAADGRLNWSTAQAVHMVGVLLNWDRRGEQVEGFLKRGHDEWVKATVRPTNRRAWQTLAAEEQFAGNRSAELAAQAEHLTDMLAQHTADEHRCGGGKQRSPSAATVVVGRPRRLPCFTRRQNCSIFCRAHGIPFTLIPPTPLKFVSLAATLSRSPLFSDVSPEDVASMSRQLRSFLDVLMLVHVAPENTEIIRVAHNMCSAGGFCGDDDHLEETLVSCTKWEKISERLASPKPGLQVDPEIAERIYSNWADAYKFELCDEYEPYDDFEFCDENAMDRDDGKEKLECTD